MIKLIDEKVRMFPNEDAEIVNCDIHIKNEKEEAVVVSLSKK